MFMHKLARSLSTCSAVYKETSAVSAKMSIGLENVSKVQSAALLQERCILVNASDQITGSASKLACHVWDPVEQTSPLHRAFSVFLFNTKGELLLQQRSMDKVTFPGYYTNSCCSHPLSVDDECNGVDGAVRAAIRRVSHELGVPQQQLAAEEFQYLTRMLYSGREDGSPFAEHEVDYILFLQKDVSLAPNPDEVKHVEYVARNNILEYLKTLEQENIPITPWFRLIVKYFLLKWWDHLANLDQFKDHKCIHKF